MDNAVQLKAPSYNDLAKQLTELSARLNEMESRSLSTPDYTASINRSTNELQEFRILPDFNKSIGMFTGGENSIQAKDWLDTLEGTANINRWPEAVKIQFVCNNVTGAGRNWFLSGNFMTWVDLKKDFCATFVRTTSK